MRTGLGVLAACCLISPDLSKAQDRGNGEFGLLADNLRLVHRSIQCVLAHPAHERDQGDFRLESLVGIMVYKIEFALTRVGNPKYFSLHTFPQVNEINGLDFFPGHSFDEGTIINLPGPPAIVIDTDFGTVEIPHRANLPVDGLPENEGATPAAYYHTLHEFLAAHCPTS